MLAGFVWRSPANLKSIRRLLHFSTHFPLSFHFLMLPAITRDAVPREMHLHDRMIAMNEVSDARPKGSTEASPQPPKPHQGYVHRVCIQCNNVFRVPSDKFDAKQCPNCHKG